MSSEAVRDSVAAQLTDLLVLAGSSTRKTGIAVALVRLGHADKATQKLAAEVETNAGRLDDCGNSLARWRWISQQPGTRDLSDAQLVALRYAELELRLAALEAACVDAA